MSNKWDKYKISSFTLPKEEPVENETEVNKWSKYKISEYKPKDKTKSFVPGRKSLVKSIRETKLEDITQHPFITSLKGLGAGFEVAEGIPAALALGLQEKQEFKPSGFLPTDITKFFGQPQVKEKLKGVVTGEKPVQMGDVFRKAGFPEPMAATLGLLSTGAPAMPTEIMSKGLVKGVSKITQLPSLINSFGKPFISKSMSVLSGIPEDDIVRAIDNPNILNKSWIAKEAGEVSKIYKNEIEPVVRNVNNRIDTTKLIPDLDNIKLNIEGTTEATRQATTMRVGELSKINKWLDDIKVKNISLNRLDAIIGEMDEGLQKVYSNIEKQKAEPVTRTFENLTLQLRKGLQKLRDTQYSELAPKFKRYADLKNAEKIYNNFDKWQPKLLNMALAGTIAGPIGQAMGLPWATISSLTMGSTIPKIQAGAIKLGSQLTKEAGKSAALPLMVGKKITE